MKARTLKIARIIILALLAISASFSFTSKSLQLRNLGFIDTPTFIMQLAYFMDSGELYRNPLKSGGDLENFEPSSPWFKFPPIYMLDYLPFITGQSHEILKDFGRQSGELLKLLWKVHVIRYLLAVTALLLLLNRNGSVEFFLLGLSLALLFSPVFESLYGLIFDNLLLFFCVLILLGLRTRQQTASAVIMAIAAMMKLYPVLLVLPALLAGNRKIIITLLISMMLLLLVSLLLFGPDNNFFYYCRLLPVLLKERSMDAAGNLSTGRYFVHFAPDTGMQWFGLFKNSLLVASAIILYRAGKSGQLTDENAMSVVICLMLLYLPNYWPNYQLILIIPVLVLLANAFNKQPFGKMHGCAALACWLVLTCSTDNHGVYMPDWAQQYPDITSAIAAWRPFVPLLLWLVCCHDASRKRNTAVGL